MALITSPVISNTTLYSVKYGATGIWNTFKGINVKDGNFSIVSKSDPLLDIKNISVIKSEIADDGTEISTVGCYISYGIPGSGTSSGSADFLLRVRKQSGETREFKLTVEFIEKTALPPTTHTTNVQKTAGANGDFTFSISDVVNTTGTSGLIMENSSDYLNVIRTGANTYRAWAEASGNYQSLVRWWKSDGTTYNDIAGNINVTILGAATTTTINDSVTVIYNVPVFHEIKYTGKIAIDLGFTGLPEGLSILKQDYKYFLVGLTTAIGSFTCTATGRNNTGNLAITVQNYPPVFLNSPSSFNVHIGIPFSWEPVIVDSNGLSYKGTVTFSAQNLPGGFSINSATGKISGTPTASSTATVTAQAPGGQNSIQISFILTSTQSADYASIFHFNNYQTNLIVDDMDSSRTITAVGSPRILAPPGTETINNVTYNLGSTCIFFPNYKDFNNQPHFVRVLPTATGELNLGSNDFVIEAWVKLIDLPLRGDPASTSYAAENFNLGDTGTFEDRSYPVFSSYGLTIFITYSKIGVVLGNTNRGRVIVGTGNHSNSLLNKWAHIAFIRTTRYTNKTWTGDIPPNGATIDSTYRLLLNGAQLSTYTTSYSYIESSDFYIGINKLFNTPNLLSEYGELIKQSSNGSTQSITTHVSGFRGYMTGFRLLTAPATEGKLSTVYPNPSNQIPQTLYNGTEFQTYKKALGIPEQAGKCISPVGNYDESVDDRLIKYRDYPYNTPKPAFLDLPLKEFPDISYTNGTFNGISWTATDLPFSLAIAEGEQLYRSTDYNNTWLPVDSPRNWTATAMSEDGSIQLAAAGNPNGGIYRSTDNGVTWSIISGTSGINWTALAMSGTGQYITALASTTSGGTNSGIYVSSNSGASWTIADLGSTFRNRQWTSAAMSFDGRYQLIAADKIGTTNNAEVRSSSDFGGFWATPRDNQFTPQNLPNSRWTAVAVSRTGQYQTIVGQDTTIRVSSNSGSNFSSTGAANNWRDIAMSSNGAIQTAVATVLGTSTGGIFRSTNSGGTFSSVANTSGIDWRGVAISASGTNQTATAYGGQIYRSTNSGQNWTPVGTSKNWTSVTSVNNNVPTRPGFCFEGWFRILPNRNNTGSSTTIAEQAAAILMTIDMSTANSDLVLDTQTYSNTPWWSRSAPPFTIAVDDCGEIIIFNGTGLSFNVNGLMGDLATDDQLNIYKYNPRPRITRNEWFYLSVSCDARKASSSGSFTGNEGRHLVHIHINGKPYIVAADLGTGRVLNGEWNKGTTYNGGVRLGYINKSTLAANPNTHFQVVEFYDFKMSFGWSNGSKYGPNGQLGNSAATGYTYTPPTRAQASILDNYTYCFIDGSMYPTTDSNTARAGKFKWYRPKGHNAQNLALPNYVGGLQATTTTFEELLGQNSPFSYQDGSKADVFVGVCESTRSSVASSDPYFGIDLIDSTFKNYTISTIPLNPDLTKATNLLLNFNQYDTQLRPIDNTGNHLVYYRMPGTTLICSDDFDKSTVSKFSKFQNGVTVPQGALLLLGREGYVDTSLTTTNNFNIDISGIRDFTLHFWWSPSRILNYAQQAVLFNLGNSIQLRTQNWVNNSTNPDFSRTQLWLDVGNNNNFTTHPNFSTQLGTYKVGNTIPPIKTLNDNVFTHPSPNSLSWGTWNVVSPIDITTTGLVSTVKVSLDIRSFSGGALTDTQRQNILFKIRSPLGTEVNFTALQYNTSLNTSQAIVASNLVFTNFQGEEGFGAWTFWLTNNSGVSLILGGASENRINRITIAATQQIPSLTLGTKDNWHHIAVIRKNNYLQAFVDGEEKLWRPPIEFITATAGEGTPTALTVSIPYYYSIQFYYDEVYRRIVYNPGSAYGFTLSTASRTTPVTIINDPTNNDNPTTYTSLNITTNAVIAAVYINLNITFPATFVDDPLYIYLISPTGTRISLSDQAQYWGKLDGRSTDNSLIVSNLTVPGFIGEQSAGTWQLEIINYSYPNNTSGTLNSWSVNVITGKTSVKITGVTFSMSMTHPSPNGLRVTLYSPDNNARYFELQSSGNVILGSTNRNYTYASGTVTITNYNIQNDAYGSGFLDSSPIGAWAINIQDLNYTGTTRPVLRSWSVTISWTFTDSPNINNSTTINFAPSPNTARFGTDRTTQTENSFQYTGMVDEFSFIRDGEFFTQSTVNGTRYITVPTTESSAVAQLNIVPIIPDNQKIDVFSDTYFSFAPTVTNLEGNEVYSIEFTGPVAGDREESTVTVNSTNGVISGKFLTGVDKTVTIKYIVTKPNSARVSNNITVNIKTSFNIVQGPVLRYSDLISNDSDVLYLKKINKILINAKGYIYIYNLDDNNIKLCNYINLPARGGTLNQFEAVDKQLPQYGQFLENNEAYSWAASGTTVYVSVRTTSLVNDSVQQYNLYFADIGDLDLTTAFSLAPASFTLNCNDLHNADPNSDEVYFKNGTSNLLYKFTLGTNWEIVSNISDVNQLKYFATKDYVKQAKNKLAYTFNLSNQHHQIFSDFSGKDCNKTIFSTSSILDYFSSYVSSQYPPTISTSWHHLTPVITNGNYADIDDSISKADLYYYGGSYFILYNDEDAFTNYTTSSYRNILNTKVGAIWGPNAGDTDLEVKALLPRSSTINNSVRYRPISLATYRKLGYDDTFNIVVLADYASGENSTLPAQPPITLLSGEFKITISKVWKNTSRVSANNTEYINNSSKTKVIYNGTILGYVLIPDTGTSNQFIFTENGYTWKHTTIPQAEYKALATSDQNVIIVLPNAGGSGTSNTTFSRSMDGGKTFETVVWNIPSINPTTTYTILDLAFGNGQWIATTNSPGVNLISSNDGTSWAVIGGLASLTSSIRKVRYFNGRWVAISSTNGIICHHSIDGVTWTAMTTTRIQDQTIRWEDVVFHNNNYIFYSSAPNKQVLRTINLNTYNITLELPIVAAFSNIIIGNDNILYGFCLNNTKAYYTSSNNGDTWSAQTINIPGETSLELSNVYPGAVSKAFNEMIYLFPYNSSTQTIFMDRSYIQPFTLSKVREIPVHGSPYFKFPLGKIALSPLIIEKMSQIVLLNGASGPQLIKYFPYGENTLFALNSKTGNLLNDGTHFPKQVVLKNTGITNIELASTAPYGRGILNNSSYNAPINTYQNSKGENISERNSSFVIKAKSSVTASDYTGDYPDDNLLEDQPFTMEGWFYIGSLDSWTLGIPTATTPSIPSSHVFFYGEKYLLTKKDALGTATNPVQYIIRLYLRHPVETTNDYTYSKYNMYLNVRACVDSAEQIIYDDVKITQDGTINSWVSQWKHVALVRSTSGEINVFVDGQCITTNIPAPVQSNYHFPVAFDIEVGNLFTGVSDVKITRQELYKKNQQNVYNKAISGGPLVPKYSQFRRNYQTSQSKSLQLSLVGDLAKANTITWTTPTVQGLASGYTWTVNTSLSASKPTLTLFNSTVLGAQTSWIANIDSYQFYLELPFVFYSLTLNSSVDGQSLQYQQNITPPYYNTTITKTISWPNKPTPLKVEIPVVIPEFNTTVEIINFYNPYGLIAKKVEFLRNFSGGAVSKTQGTLRFILEKGTGLTEYFYIDVIVRYYLGGFVNGAAQAIAHNKYSIQCQVPLDISLPNLPTVTVLLNTNITPIVITMLGNVDTYGKNLEVYSLPTGLSVAYSQPINNQYGGYKTATITGAISQDSSISVRAIDIYDNIEAKTFLINVDPGFTFQPLSNRSLEVEIPITIQLDIALQSGVYITNVTYAGFPPTSVPLTFSVANNQISGQFAFNINTFNCSVTVTSNIGGVITRSFVLNTFTTVPVIVPTDKSIVVGLAIAPISIQVPDESLVQSISVTNLQDGLTYNSVTKQITGTTFIAQEKEVTITVIASGGGQTVGKFKITSILSLDLAEASKQITLYLNKTINPVITMQVVGQTPCLDVVFNDPSTVGTNSLPGGVSYTKATRTITGASNELHNVKSLRFSLIYGYYYPNQMSTTQIPYVVEKIVPLKTLIDLKILINGSSSIPNEFRYNINRLQTPILNVAGQFLKFNNAIDEAYAQIQVFTVSGENLAGSVVITASVNFEISQDNQTFNQILSLTNTNGNLSSTTIYVRLKPTLTVGNYSGDITISTINYSPDKIIPAIGEVKQEAEPFGSVKVFDIDQISSLFDVNIPREQFTLGFLIHAINRWSDLIKLDENILRRIRKRFPNFVGITLAKFSWVAPSGAVASCGPQQGVVIDGKNHTISMVLNVAGWAIDAAVAGTFPQGGPEVIEAYWRDVMAHELGHALGIGTLWYFYGNPPPENYYLISTFDSNTLPTYYPLTRAIYSTYAGGERIKVPILFENSPGAIGNGGHWEHVPRLDDGIEYPGVSNEIMTYSPWNNPVISALTIGNIMDLSYYVSVGLPGADIGEGQPTIVNIGTGQSTNSTQTENTSFVCGTCEHHIVDTEVVITEIITDEQSNEYSYTHSSKPDQKEEFVNFSTGAQETTREATFITGNQAIAPIIITVEGTSFTEVSNIEVIGLDGSGLQYSYDQVNRTGSIFGTPSYSGIYDIFIKAYLGETYFIEETFKIIIIHNDFDLLIPNVIGANANFSGRISTGTSNVYNNLTLSEIYSGQFVNQNMWIYGINLVSGSRITSFQTGSAPLLTNYDVFPDQQNLGTDLYDMDGKSYAFPASQQIPTIEVISVGATSLVWNNLPPGITYNNITGKLEGSCDEINTWYTTVTATSNSGKTITLPNYNQFKFQATFSVEAENDNIVMKVIGSSPRKIELGTTISHEQLRANLRVVAYKEGRGYSETYILDSDYLNIVTLFLGIPLIVTATPPPLFSIVPNFEFYFKENQTLPTIGRRIPFPFTPTVYGYEQVTSWTPPLNDFPPGATQNLLTGAITGLITEETYDPDLDLAEIKSFTVGACINNYCIYTDIDWSVKFVKIVLLANQTLYVTKNVAANVGVSLSGSSDVPYLWSYTGDLPQGLSFNTQNGRITGIPIGNEGNYQITVRAYHVPGHGLKYCEGGIDGCLDSTPVTVTINVSNLGYMYITPEITLSSLVSLPIQANVLFLGGEAPTDWEIYDDNTINPWNQGTFTISSLGVITGTPESVGTYRFGVRGKIVDTNKELYSNVCKVIIDVYIAGYSINMAPNLSNSTITALNNVSFTSTVVNSGGNINSITIVGDPVAGVTAQLDAQNKNITISGTLATVGTYTLTIDATNLYGTVQVVVTINVTDGRAAIASNQQFFLEKGKLLIGTEVLQITGPAATSVDFVTLPAGLTYNVNTRVFGGTPTGNSGVFDVTATATNASGTSDPATIQFSISDAKIEIEPGQQIEVTQYEQFSEIITTTGAISTGVINTSLTGVDLSISGDPKVARLTGLVAAPGTYSVFVTLNNFGSSDTELVQLVVLPREIVIPNTLSFTGTVGTYFEQTITATSGTPNGWNITANALFPPGIAFSFITGRFTGTPRTPGVYTIEVFALNSFVNSNICTVTITITAASTPPIIDSDQEFNILNNTQYNDLTVSYTGGDPTSWNAVDLPAGLVINQTSGKIYGFVTQLAGTYSSIITATNSSGSSRKSVTFVVANFGEVAIPANQEFEFVLDQPITTNNQLNYTGLNVIISSITPMPTGLSITSSGLLQGTPRAAGVYNITLRASNNVSQVTQTISIVITRELLPPTLAESLTPITLTRNVMMIPYNFVNSGGVASSWSAVNIPAGLSFNSLTGTISGRPTVVGNDTVTVTAINSAGTDSTTLGIAVVSNLTSPTIENQTVVANINSNLSRQLTASGTVTTWSIVGQSLNWITLNSVTGVLSGVPNQLGSFNIVVKVANSAGFDEATITINVTSNLTVPVIRTGQIVSRSKGVNFSYRISLTSNSDPATSWRVQTGGTLPPGLSLDPDNGYISGTPTVAGSTTTQIIASNSAGESTPQGVSIVITESVGAIPSIAENQIFSATVNTQFSRNIVYSGTVTEWRVISGTLPNGLTLNGATGNISGIPASYTAPSTVRIFAGNSNGSDEKDITIGVNAALIKIAPNQVLSGFAGDSFNQNIQFQGGVTEWTSDLPNELGLTLSNTGAITGTPTVEGEFNIVVTATHTPSGTNANGVIKLVIQSKIPKIVSGQTISAATNNYLSYGIAHIVLGGAGVTKWSMLTTLPQGLTLNSNTGIIQGTPTQATTSNYIVKAENSYGSSTGSINITIVSVAGLLKINPEQTFIAQANTYFEFTPVYVGIPTNWYILEPLAGITINNTTGKISGTLAAGNYRICVYCENTRFDASAFINIVVS